MVWWEAREGRERASAESLSKEEPRDREAATVPRAAKIDERTTDLPGLLLFLFIILFIQGRRKLNGSQQYPACRSETRLPANCGIAHIRNLLDAGLRGLRGSYYCSTIMMVHVRVLLDFSSILVLSAHLIRSVLINDLEVCPLIKLAN